MDFKISQIQTTKKLVLEGSDVDNDLFVRIRDEIFKKYPEGQILQCLELLDTNIDNTKIHHIVDLSKRFQVERLILDGSFRIAEGMWKDNGLQRLCALLENCPLAYLSLQRMGITDEFAPLLGTLANRNPLITKIKLGKNNISEGVMKDLSAIKHISFDDSSNSFNTWDEKKN